MANVTIVAPHEQPVLIQSKQTGKYDPGIVSIGLLKGYSNYEIQARQLGLRTIHHIVLQRVGANHSIKVGGSITARGSKSNKATLYLGSAGTVFGTFAYAHFIAQGY